MELSKQLKELLDKQIVEIPWHPPFVILLNGFRAMLFKRDMPPGIHYYDCERLYYRIETLGNKGRVRIFISFSNKFFEHLCLTKDVGQLASIRMRERLVKAVSKKYELIEETVRKDLEEISELVLDYIARRQELLIKQAGDKIQYIHLGAPESFEQKIARVIVGLKDQIKNGKLAVKLIADTINRGKSEKEKFTYTLVGKRLDKMGFQKSPTSTGASAILLSEKLLELTVGKYGLPGTEDEAKDSESLATSETDALKDKSDSSESSDGRLGGGNPQGDRQGTTNPLKYESKGLVRRGEIPADYWDLRRRGG